jgi:Rieske 2Fe-2S family protein
MITVFRKTAETFAAGAKTLAQQYFVSPHVFEQEQKQVFSKQWVLVGHQSQLPEPGDYFLAVIAEESVVVIRDQRSVIRGFYNVCRHRGTRLKEDACGHASAIRCPYHAWTYGLDGRLIGAPHMDQLPDFDKADYSLHAVNLALWEGLIFVNLADSPTPLEEWFAPLNGKISHCKMSI